MHANANQPYDSLIPPKNKNEGVHFRADTGVRPYDFKFPEVGVTPCGYPFAYVLGWVHFRLDTGVCPYTFKFPEVGVTPCGYPFAYAMM